jgi:hypothetical protein
MPCRQHDEQHRLAREENIGADQERIGSLPNESGKGRFDLALGAALT